MGETRDLGRADDGFTLLELMVTLSVLAILLAVAIPSFRQTLQSNRVSTRVNELVGTIAYARSEAIRSSRGVGLCPSADGSSCGKDWSSGWLVWSDFNGNGTRNDGDTVVRSLSVGVGVATSGPTTGILAFDSRGRSRSGGVSFSIQPTDCESNEPLLRTLTVSATGGTSVSKGTCENEADDTE